MGNIYTNMSSADAPVNPKKLAKDKLKQKKLEKGYKLPKEIIVIKNKDKRDHESWTASRKKDLANFPCPSRFIVVARPGSGKTLTIQNILLRARPLYDVLVLVHPDGQISREWEELEPTHILEEPPGTDFYEQLIDEKGRFPKTCVVIDDLEIFKARKDVLSNIATLLRYYSTHRFITTFLSYQSFFDIPPIFRKLANVFIIYRPLITNEFTTIENRLGMEKDQLRTIFDELCPGIHDFLTIDHTPNTPAPLRLGLFKKIIIENPGGSSPSGSDVEPEDELECDF